ncbi:MAG TPA: MBOAT family O-acyltransferase [Allosphingosinicella sp.]|nr:MBOAT family O-acyltransferase [Allosphingosinicella sp.]
MLTYDARFIALFYPLLLLLFWMAGRRSPGAAVSILLAASAVFYALADTAHAPLIAATTILNFAIGLALTRASDRRAGHWTAAGIVLNVACLAFYKYWSAPGLSPGTTPAAGVIQTGLPLGLSFFILKQISWFSDIRTARPGPLGARDLPRFALYSIFFPQMIAGPVYRFRDAAADYATLGKKPLGLSSLAVGLSVFAVGLAKKLLLADPLGTVASPVFDAVAAGHDPGLAEAWIGAWAYSLQLYFDFSGISDMALGIGLTVGLRLPINFYSPFKARRGSEFFDRWHISLVIFVRTYLFSPILRLVRRHASGTAAVRTMKATATATLVSLTLVGWWHGAKATFVLSGLLAGLGSVALQLAAFRQASTKRRGGARTPSSVSRVLLMLAVIGFGILFRSQDLRAAGEMLLGLAGLSGAAGSTALLPALGQLAGESAFHLATPVPGGGLLVMAAATAIAFGAPNTVQIFRLYDHPGAPQPEGGARTGAHLPHVRWALAAGLFVALALMQAVNGDLQGTIYARF